MSMREVPYRFSISTIKIPEVARTEEFEDLAPIEAFPTICEIWICELLYNDT